ncbi:MAG: hypothetical protein ACI4DP_13825 [Candidatus Ornithomonoglobus sp.]
MRKIFENPEMTIRTFPAMNIITTSGTVTPDTVKNDLVSGKITLDSKTFSSEASNILSYTF